MNAGSELLKPLLISSGVKASGTVVLGTVKGDLHDIGKNLVRMMMEGKGLEVIDLGIDVPSSKFIEKAQETGAQIIACSALLTTTMTEMKNVVEAAKEAGIRDKVTIMVGGAPVTDSFCQSIGAEYILADAAQLPMKLQKFAKHKKDRGSDLERPGSDLDFKKIRVGPRFQKDRGRALKDQGRISLQLTKAGSEFASVID